MEPQRNMIRVIGYKWIANGGHKACPRCAALHGKKLLFKDIHPDLMPEPPLHVNCRCTRQEIVEFVDTPTITPVAGEDQFEGQSDDEQMPDYMQRAGVERGLLGLSWRDVLKRSNWTPVYGKYCGENWSRGHDTGVPGSKPADNPDPMDDLDAACAGHDNCYDMLNKSTCDQQLVETVRGLSSKPEMWRNPPEGEAQRQEAEMYRRKLIWAFERLIDLEKMKDKVENEILITP